MKFIALPTDVFVSALNFCGLKDLQKLDSALSSISDRQFLLDCLQMIECSTVKGDESLWICFRKDDISNITIDGKKNAAKTKQNMNYYVNLLKHTSLLTTLSVHYSKTFKLDLFTDSNVIFEKLQKVHFQGLFGNFNDDIFVAMCRQSPSLEDIHIVDCTGLVSADAVALGFNECVSLNSFCYIDQYCDEDFSTVLMGFNKQNKSIDLDCQTFEYYKDLVQYFDVFQCNFIESIHLDHLNNCSDTFSLFNIIIQKCLQLKCLKLSHFDSFDILQNIRHLVDALPTLLELHLQYFYLCDAGDFDVLFDEKLPAKLSTLRVEHCETITTDMIKHILSVNPDLSQLSVSNNRVVDKSEVQNYVEVLVSSGRKIKLLLNDE